MKRYSRHRISSRLFIFCQVLLDRRAIAAGHDISDGGIITALSEMAFAGNCGIVVDLPSPADDNSQLAPFSTLFAEELGLLLEVLGISVLTHFIVPLILACETFLLPTLVFRMNLRRLIFIR